MGIWHEVKCECFRFVFFVHEITPYMDRRFSTREQVSQKLFFVKSSHRICNVTTYAAGFRQQVETRDNTRETNILGALSHIANIIVAPEGEGRGIGRVLMEKGDEQPFS
jgi:ribosomal protein S18 acetylase RimI-like enzyme